MLKTKSIYFKILSFIAITIVGAFIFVNRIKAETTEELQQKINDNKQKIEELEKKSAVYQENIKQKQKEIASLSNQVAIIDNKMAKTNLDIEATGAKIDGLELEIKETSDKIAEKETKIALEKEQLSSLLRGIDKSDKQTLLQVVMANNSISAFFDQVQSLMTVQKNLQGVLDNIQEIKSLLEEQKVNLQKEKDQQDQFKTTLEDQKNLLDSQKDEKKNVLSATRNSEKQFQALLSAVKKEQNQANAEIANAEKTLRAKLMAEKDKSEYFSDSVLIWPVAKNTITAIFHDPTYIFNRYFEHNAIDIRVSQGTAIKAAASGYVAKAKNAGMGYSYIMLIHGDGISTVYGHVSRIIVSVDQYVTKGEIIGYSGGLPGTPGAGSFTTGAHLHFEVRSNGIPVDPMDYLP